MFASQLTQRILTKSDDDFLHSSFMFMFVSYRVATSLSSRGAHNVYSLPSQQVTFIPLFFHSSVVVLLETGKILRSPSVSPITLCLFEEARLRNRPTACFRK